MSWSDLIGDAKADAISAILEANPKFTYPDVAKILGTSASAIAGAMFRAGRTKLYATPRPVNPQAHDVVKEIFASVYAKGLSDRDIAKRSGYAMETVWGIRTGVRNTSLRTISDIAQVMGLKLYVGPE